MIGETQRRLRRLRGARPPIRAGHGRPPRRRRDRAPPRPGRRRATPRGKSRPHARRCPRQHHDHLLTNTALSGARLYWENWGKVGFFNAKGVSIPVAVSVFPDELYPAPAELGRTGVPQTHSLQPAPKRRPLRCVGATRTLCGRAPFRVQITSGGTVTSATIITHRFTYPYLKDEKRFMGCSQTSWSSPLKLNCRRISLLERRRRGRLMRCAVPAFTANCSCSGSLAQATARLKSNR